MSAADPDRCRSWAARCASGGHWSLYVVRTRACGFVEANASGWTVCVRGVWEVKNMPGPHQASHTPHKNLCPQTGPAPGHLRSTFCVSLSSCPAEPPRGRALPHAVHLRTSTSLMRVHAAHVHWVTGPTAAECTGALTPVPPLTSRYSTFKILNPPEVAEYPMGPWACWGMKNAHVQGLARLPE